VSSGPIALFVPCFVEHLAPATLDNLRMLLARLGVEHVVPPGQTCCGQPSFNAGFFAEAASCAEHLVRLFEPYAAVVAPSASCVAMVRHYPALREIDPALMAATEALARRTFEICEYLVEQRGVTDVGASYHGAVAYHDACHALRQLDLRDQPRALLRQVDGLELRELPGPPQCCGFGGTFSVKYPELSADMADAKLSALAATGTHTLVSTDLSCLQHLEARARRRALPFEGLHVIDLLAAGAGSERGAR